MRAFHPFHSPFSLVNVVRLAAKWVSLLNACRGRRERGYGASPVPSVLQGALSLMLMNTSITQFKLNRMSPYAYCILPLSHVRQ